MRRFFFDVVTESRRYGDATGMLLDSLHDVLPHATAIAKMLTRDRLLHQGASGRSPNPTYIEIEDEQRNLIIALPFTRLLAQNAAGMQPIQLPEHAPIDLGKHRMATRYAEAVRGMNAIDGYSRGRSKKTR